MKPSEADQIIREVYVDMDLLEDALMWAGADADTIGHARKLRADIAKILDIKEPVA